MPLIFSYGSLRQTEVQIRTYGRPLHGKPDTLIGFEKSQVPIEDAKRRAIHQQTHYSNVIPAPNASSGVDGMVFEITNEELIATDRYEALDGYSRIEAVLTSGSRAWVYVHARDVFSRH